MTGITSKLQNYHGKLIAGKGASLLDVAKAEKELEVKFAEDYKECLQHYGPFGFDGHEITGLTDDPRWDVVAITKQQRKIAASIPTGWYVIEITNVDGIIIWQGADGKIYGNIPGYAPELLASNLAQFLSV